MKIGLFSDSHYCKEEALEGSRMCSLSLGKIKNAFDCFKESRVDLVMCLGDMADAGENLEESKRCLDEIMKLIRSYNIPFLFVTGNHDFKVFPLEELKICVRLPVPPMIYEMEKYRIICLDANYKSDMAHYDPSGFDWKDTNLPEDQLIFLQEALQGSEKRCIVAIHEPIDRKVGEWYRVKNATDIRKIIEDSGKVSLVIQGHMHEYDDFVENGVRYLTVTGMCEGLQNRFLILENGPEGTEFVVRQCNALLPSVST